MSLNIFMKKFPFISKTKIIFIKRRYFLLKNKKELINKLDVINKKLNSSLVLEYGTLLGCIRDKAILLHDYDLDFGIDRTLWNKDIRKICQREGLLLRHEFKINKEIVEESYIYKGIVIDFFYYTISGGEILTPVFRKENKEWVLYNFKNDYKGLVLSIFENESFNIPVNFDKHLISYYGPNYLIPDKNWKGPNDAISTALVGELVKY